MTVEEKLNHFEQICLEDARARADKMLEDYKSGLESTFKEHQESMRRQAEQQVQIEKERIERDIRRQVSIGQIEQKREVSAKQEELKDKLFTEVRDLLSAFMETEAYAALLEKQVKEAVAFAGNEEMTIYFDPSDADKLARISLHTSANIVVSAYSFGGGMRAVIPKKNILIDNSFDAKVAEAKRDYQFRIERKGAGTAAGAQAQTANGSAGADSEARQAADSNSGTASAAQNGGERA